jgi:hypothetical protein
MAGAAITPEVAARLIAHAVPLPRLAGPIAKPRADSDGMLPKFRNLPPPWLRSGCAKKAGHDIALQREQRCQRTGRRYREHRAVGHRDENRLRVT